MAKLTMSLSLLLLTALVAGTSEYRRAASDILLFQPYDNTIQDEVDSPIDAKPAFCKKLDCPAYAVIEKKDGYELREYDMTFWVSTRSQGIDYDKATYTNFMKLFKYIEGNNVEKKKIDMTVPVLNKIIPGQGPACESDFTMNFYLTQNRSGIHFPQPIDPSVLLTRTPPGMRVYVRSFRGYVMKYDAWRHEAEKLITALGNSTQYDRSAWYTASYNSPFELFNRHNEIWFLVQRI